MCDAPNSFVNPFVLRVCEMGLGNTHRDGWIAIQEPGIPETSVLVLPKDLCPFCTLKRNAVVARETSGNESDSMIRYRSKGEGRHELGSSVFIFPFRVRFDNTLELNM